MSYFPERYTCSKNKIKFKLDLFKYATESSFSNITGADTSKFAKNVDLANLKSDVEKLDVD